MRHTDVKKLLSILEEISVELHFTNILLNRVADSLDRKPPTLPQNTKSNDVSGPEALRTPPRPGSRRKTPSGAT